MAQPQYNMEKLIENIKRRCAVPTSQLTFTNEDWALLANDQLQGIVVPEIMSLRQEYFVDFYDTNPVNGIVEFPDDTVVSTIRQVAWVQNTNPLVLYTLPRLDLDTVAGIGVPNIANPAGYYIQGNQMMITPSNANPNLPLRVYYFKRSLVLTSPENYGRIESIDYPSRTLVLSNVPMSWDDSTILNSVNQSSPFNCVVPSLEIEAVSDPSIVVSSVEGLKIGDYISELGFSAIPQVPIEAHAYLAQLTAVIALQSLGDTTGAKTAQGLAEQLKINLGQMMANRVQGSTQKLVTANGGLRFQNGSGRWRTRGF